MLTIWQQQFITMKGCRFAVQLLCGASTRLCAYPVLVPEADSKELLLNHQDFLPMIAVCNMAGVFPHNPAHRTKKYPHWAGEIHYREISLLLSLNVLYGRSSVIRKFSVSQAIELSGLCQEQ